MTAKQEPKKKPSPLGEGGRREPDGRGELGNYLDCLTTNAPTPTTAAQINRTKSEGPYNTASELPLSEPSRAHLSPKGEAHIIPIPSI